MRPSRARAEGLRDLQGWMQACVMAAEPADEAEAARRVRPSRMLTPAERVEIYRGMYALRLTEALRVDYPGLAAYLGEETFDELARLYIGDFPSQSYTLNRLGDRLPAFLREVEGLRRPRFAEALARLELAETEVFDAEETEAAAGLPAGLAETEWAGLRFTPLPALRLVALDYPAHEYLQAVRREERPVAPRRRKCYLAVVRRRYGVRHVELSRAGHALLTRLNEGVALGPAIEGLPAGGSSRRVFEWFREWFGEGLFARVDAG